MLRPSRGPPLRTGRSRPRGERSCTDHADPIKLEARSAGYEEAVEPLRRSADLRARRYREESGKRYKTVELIVEETEWVRKVKRSAGAALVALRINWNELELRRIVKSAGGTWDPVKRVWELCRDRVVELGLEQRIVK